MHSLRKGIGRVYVLHSYKTFSLCMTHVLPIVYISIDLHVCVCRLSTHGFAVPAQEKGEVKLAYQKLQALVSYYLYMCI